MDLKRIVDEALAEDLKEGRDITCDFFVDPEEQVNARIEARQAAMVSGLDVVRAVFHALDPSLRIEPQLHDGERIHRFDVAIRLRGSASAILRGERTALNFLGHLSGVATRTAEFVEAARQNETPSPGRVADPTGMRIRVLCTRKTLPGLRELEVQAVRHGGGDAFRTSLSEAVMLKDNHLALLGGLDGVERRLSEIRQQDPREARRLLESGKIEVSSLSELERAVSMGWKQILLDNFTVAQVRKAVERFGGRASLEVSGGVNLKNIGRYAATGAQAISVGAITHSVPSVDFSLEFEGR